MSVIVGRGAGERFFSVQGRVHREFLIFSFLLVESYGEIGFEGWELQRWYLGFLCWWCHERLGWGSLGRGFRGVVVVRGVSMFHGCCGMSCHG